jgi:hypothetical protein
LAYLLLAVRNFKPVDGKFIITHYKIRFHPFHTKSSTQKDAKTEEKEFLPAVGDFSHCL